MSVYVIDKNSGLIHIVDEDSPLLKRRDMRVLTESELPWNKPQDQIGDDSEKLGLEREEKKSFTVEGPPSGMDSFPVLPRRPRGRPRQY